MEPGLCAELGGPEGVGDETRALAPDNKIG